MGAVTAGLISATGLKLMNSLKENSMGTLVCWSLVAITFMAVAILRIPLGWVLLGLGGLACCWAYRQLGLTRKAVP